MATQVETHADPHGNGHGDHAHLPHLAHHFETPEQQFYSGKLGMWLFLIQEVLFFSGLFCAYAVYRAMHPEIFIYAHEYLDKTMGAINTCVLLFSSLTMAWGVRAAQLRQRGLLIILLSITIACGFAFMGIKYFEYKHKIDDGIMWGKYYNPLHPPGHTPAHGAEGTVEVHGHEDGEGAQAGEVGSLGPGVSQTAAPDAIVVENPPGVGTPDVVAPAPTDGPPVDPNAAVTPATATGSTQPKPGIAPGGTIPQSQIDVHAPPQEPRNVQIFFGIYFCMTGLHGLHVVIGIGVLFWLLVRAMRGEFADGYFEPVDFVGLYWHLVDLVWIFLFPLLYLIH